MQKELEEERKLDIQILEHKRKEKEYTTHPLLRANASVVTGKLPDKKSAVSVQPN